MFKSANMDSSPPPASIATSAPVGSSLSSKAGTLRVTPEGDLKLVGDSGVLGKGTTANSQQEQKQKFFATRSADGKWNLLMAPTSDPSRLFLVQPAPGHNYKFQMTEGGPRMESINMSENNLGNGSSPNGCEDEQSSPVSTTENVEQSTGIAKSIAVPVAQLRASSSVSPLSSSHTTTATTPTNVGTKTTTATDAARPCNSAKHKKPTFFKSRSASDREALKASAAHVIKAISMSRKGSKSIGSMQTGHNSKHGKKGKSASKSSKKTSVSSASPQECSDLLNTAAVTISFSKSETLVKFSDNVNTVSSLSVPSVSVTVNSPSSSVSSTCHMTPSSDLQLGISPSSPLGQNNSELSAVVSPQSTDPLPTVLHQPTDTLHSNSATDKDFQDLMDENSDTSMGKERHSDILDEKTVPSAGGSVEQDGATVSVSIEKHISTHQEDSLEADCCSKSEIKVNKDTESVADAIDNELHSSQELCSSVDKCKTGNALPVAEFDSDDIDGSRNESISGVLITASVHSGVPASDNPFVCHTQEEAAEENISASEKVDKDSSFSSEINRYVGENAKVTDGHIPESSEEAETKGRDISKDNSNRTELKPSEKQKSDSSSDTDDYEFAASDTEKEKATEESPRDDVAPDNILSCVTEKSKKNHITDSGFLSTEDSQRPPFTEGDFASTEESLKASFEENGCFPSEESETKKDFVSEGNCVLTDVSQKDPTAEGDFVSTEDSPKDPSVQDDVETESEISKVSSEGHPKDVSATLILSSGETNSDLISSEQQSTLGRKKDHTENIAELVDDKVDKSCQDQSKTVGMDPSDSGAIVNSESASINDNSHTIEPKDSLDHKLDNNQEMTNEKCTIDQLPAECLGTASSVDSETPAFKSSQEVLKNVESVKSWSTVGVQQFKPKKRKKRKSELDVLIEPSSHDSETAAFESSKQFESYTGGNELEWMHSKPKKRKKRRSELETLVESGSDKAGPPVEVEEQMISLEKEPKDQSYTHSAGQEMLTCKTKQKNKKQQKLKIFIKSTSSSKSEHSDHLVTPPNNGSHAADHPAAPSSSVLSCVQQEEENLFDYDSEKLCQFPEGNSSSSHNYVENQGSVTAGISEHNEETELQTSTGMAEKTKKKKKKKSKKLKIIFGCGQETSTRELPRSGSPEACSADNSGMVIQSNKSFEDLENSTEPTPINGEQTVAPAHQKKKRKKRLSELETLIYDQAVHAKCTGKQDTLHENDLLDIAEDPSEQPSMDKDKDNRQHESEVASRDTDTCEGHSSDKNENSRVSAELESQKSADSSPSLAVGAVVSEQQPQKDTLHSVKSKIIVKPKKKKKKKKKLATNVLTMPSETSDKLAESTVSHSDYVEVNLRKTGDFDSSLTSDAMLSSVPCGVTDENNTDAPSSSAVHTMDSAPSEQQPTDDVLHSVKSKPEKPKKKRQHKKTEPTAGVIIMPPVTSGTDTGSTDVEAHSPKSVNLNCSFSTTSAVSDNTNDFSMETDDEEEANANKEMAKFLTSRSFSKWELARMFGTPFVVLEQLSDQDVYFMSRRFRNARVSSRARCSAHCRLRTLSYLCKLNLIDCKPPQDPNRTASGLPGDTENYNTEEGSPRKKKRKRKQNKEHDGKEGDAKKKKKKKKAQANDKDNLESADDVILVDTSHETVSANSQEGRNLSSSVTSLPSFPSATFGRIRMAQPASILVASPNQSTTTASPRFITVPPLVTSRTSSGPQVITIPSFSGISRPSGLPQLLAIPPVRASVNSASKIIIPALSATGQPSSLKDATRASLTQAISNSLGKTRPSVVVTPTMMSVSTVSASIQSKGPVVVQATITSTTTSTTQSNNTAPKFFMMQVGNKQVLVPVSALSMSTATTAALPSSAPAASASTATARPSLQSFIGPVGVQHSASSIPTIISAPAAGIRPNNPTSLIPGSMARIVLSNRRPSSLAPRTGPTVTSVAPRPLPTAAVVTPGTGPTATLVAPRTGSTATVVAPRTGPTVTVFASGTGATASVVASRTGAAATVVAPRTGPTATVVAPRTAAVVAPRTGPTATVVTPRTGPTASALLFASRPPARPNQVWTGPRTVDSNRRVMVTPGSQPQGIRVVLSGAGPVSSGTRFTVSSSRGGVFVASRHPPTIMKTPGPRQSRSGKRVMTEEERLRKRARLEKKYPLPPGVVIKTEPVSRGYSDEGKTTQANSNTTRVYVSTVPVASGARTQVNLAQPIPVLSAIRGGPIVIRQAQPASSSTPRPSLLAPLIIRMPNSSLNANLVSTTPTTATRVAPTVTASSLLTSMIRSAQTTNSVVSVTYPLLRGTSAATVTVSSNRLAVPSSISSMSLLSSVASAVSASNSSAAASGDVQTVPDMQQSSNEEEDPIYIADSPPPEVPACEAENADRFHSAVNSVSTSPVEITSALSSVSGGTLSAHSLFSSSAAVSPAATTTVRASPSPIMSSAPSSPAPSTSTATTSSRMASLGAMWVRQAAESPSNIPSIDTRSLQSDRMRRLKETLAKQMESMTDERRQKALQALHQQFIQIESSAGNISIGSSSQPVTDNVHIASECSEDSGAGRNSSLHLAENAAEVEESGSNDNSVNVSLPTEKDCIATDSRENLVSVDSGSDKESTQGAMVEEDRIDSDYVEHDCTDQATVPREHNGENAGQDDIHQKTVSQEGVQRNENEAALCGDSGKLPESTSSSVAQSSTGLVTDSEKVNDESDSIVNSVLESCEERPSSENSTEIHADVNTGGEKDGSDINNPAGDTTGDNSCVTSSEDRGDSGDSSQVTANSEVDHSEANKDTNENRTACSETSSGENSSVLPLVNSESSSL